MTQVVHYLCQEPWVGSTACCFYNDCGVPLIDSTETTDATKVTCPACAEAIQHKVCGMLVGEWCVCDHCQSRTEDALYREQDENLRRRRNEEEYERQWREENSI